MTDIYGIQIFNSKLKIKMLKRTTKTDIGKNINIGTSAHVQRLERVQAYIGIKNTKTRNVYLIQFLLKRS